MIWNGNNIKALAKAKGFTLSQVAESIGVTRQSLNDWAKGQMPKGNHLVALCKVLGVTPNEFFSLEESAITVPAHRSRANAKVTPERQRYALNLATEYSTFFKNLKESSVVPVVRAQDRTDDSAQSIANDLRKIAGAAKDAPITQEETFGLMAELGIYLVVRRFPKDIKAYAFYTKIHGYRVVFVDYDTNIIDLNFALLHEAVHAIRDDQALSKSYDQEEENFCDLVAGYTQFPRKYVEFVRDSISTSPNRGYQINQLKVLGTKNKHALYGIAKEIKKIDSKFSLDVGAADTNFKRGFQTLGDAFSMEDAGSYLDDLDCVSPMFLSAVLSQYGDISDRRLGELLGVEHVLDGKFIREELDKLSKQRDKE